MATDKTPLQGRAERLQEGEVMNRCSHCGQTGDMHGQADGGMICSECLRRVKEKEGIMCDTTSLRELDSAELGERFLNIKEPTDSDQ